MKKRPILLVKDQDVWNYTVSFDTCCESLAYSDIFKFCYEDRHVYGSFPHLSLSVLYVLLELQAYLIFLIPHFSKFAVYILNNITTVQRTLKIRPTGKICCHY